MAYQMFAIFVFLLLALVVALTYRLPEVPMRTSELEHLFSMLLQTLGNDLPEPVREYRFCASRRWRFDFAWPEQRVAVECQGGVWTNGRHSRGAGQEADYEKHNAAVLLGWRILYVTGGMIQQNPASLVNSLKSLLEVA